QARITLLTSSELGPRLSKKGHSYLLDGFKRRKITVREGVAVTKIEAGAVLAADGSRIEADVIISTIGFAVSPLAREAGFTTTPNGQIRVDPYLRSLSHPEIYAVGDAAATGLRMSCAAGMPVAAHAADNIIAEERGSALQPFRFGFAARCISLGRHDALIQRVNADDSPIDQIFTGRVGAAFKEFICRF